MTTPPPKTGHPRAGGGVGDERDWLVVDVSGDVWFVEGRFLTFAGAAETVRAGQVVVRDDWP